MGSKQGTRYVKTKMGDELRNKILEHSGIKLTSENTSPPYGLVVVAIISANSKANTVRTVIIL